MPERPDVKRIMLRTDHEFHSEIAALAESDSRSLNAEILHILAIWLRLSPARRAELEAQAHD